MMKRTWLTPSIVSLVLMYVVLYIWQPGGVRVLNIVTDALSVAFAVLASILALRASQMFEPGVPTRRVWLLFGVGMTAMAAADLVWAYYHDFLGRQVPFPSPADILWAISYVPVLGSLLLQYRALGVQTSRRRKLIVTALYFIVLVIAFVILLWPAFSNPGQVAGLDILISAYYLIGDLSVAFIATLSLLFLWHGLVSKPWQYIVTSVLLLFVADLAFSYGVAYHLYATGSNILSGFVDVAYLSAFVTAVAGGYRQITLRLPL